MSQYEPPRNPGEPPRPGEQPPFDEGTVVIEPLGQGGEPPVDQPETGVATRVCRNPECGQLMPAESSYCPACGTQVEEEKTRPWLLVVGVVWLLIAAAAYLIIYSSAFTSIRP